LILIDTNILIDAVSVESPFCTRSKQALVDAASRNEAVINAVVFAEFSIGVDSEAQTVEAIRRLGVRLVDIPTQALFRAGRAFTLYRRQGGARTGVLPDFFIGAHADALGIPILTRDTRRYAVYFPKVDLIHP
jgi:predicted nucleic acid-binding protein